MGHTMDNEYSRSSDPVYTDTFSPSRPSSHYMENAAISSDENRRFCLDMRFLALVAFSVVLLGT